MDFSTEKWEAECLEWFFDRSQYGYEKPYWKTSSVKLTNKGAFVSMRISYRDEVIDFQKNWIEELRAQLDYFIATNPRPLDTPTQIS